MIIFCNNLWLAPKLYTHIAIWCTLTAIARRQISLLISYKAACSGSPQQQCMYTCAHSLYNR